MLNFTILTDYKKKKKSRKRRKGRGGSREREKGLLGFCLAGNTAGPAPHLATFVKWNKY